MSSIDLLLVGGEGNGKSSTGNSILNQKAFTPRSTSFQGSDDVLQASAQIDGKTVTVVDGISLRETSTDSPANVMATISLTEKAVAMFRNGFTALLIILKYGVRFTNQEKHAIRIIKSLFGTDVLKKYGVIVMTYGDSFASDVEDDGTTFDGWCRQQTGDVKDLFRECGDRYVLFNNRAKDDGQKKAQFRNLMSKVSEVKSRTSKYTLDSFNQAKFGRQKLFAESKLPELQKETTRILDSVSQSLRKLDDNYCTSDDYLSELDSLKIKINSHKSYLQQEDEGTNSIGQLLLQISVTEASLSAKRERHLRKIEYESVISQSEPSAQLNQSKPVDNLVKYMLLGICGLVAVIIIVYFFILPAEREY